MTYGNFNYEEATWNNIDEYSEETKEHIADVLCALEFQEIIYVDTDFNRILVNIAYIGEQFSVYGGDVRIDVDTDSCGYDEDYEIDINGRTYYPAAFIPTIADIMAIADPDEA